MDGKGLEASGNKRNPSTEEGGVREIEFVAVVDLAGWSAVGPLGGEGEREWAVDGRDEISEVTYH